MRINKLSKRILSTFVAAAALMACAHDATSVANRASPSVDPLINTAWTFCDTNEALITFQPEGHVGWSSHCGDHECDCGDAHWSRNGAMVSFDCSNYTQYDVMFAAGRMHGTWHRVDDPTESAPTCLTRAGTAVVVPLESRFHLVNGKWLSSDGSLLSR